MHQATFLSQVDSTELQHISRTRRTGATDAEVVETAERRFRASSYVALRSIVCELHEGVVVLRGRVTSYQRFTSRGESDYQDKLLSAMRFQFGGHLEKPGK